MSSNPLTKIISDLNCLLSPQRLARSFLKQGGHLHRFHILARSEVESTDANLVNASTLTPSIPRCHQIMAWMDGNMQRLERLRLQQLQPQPAGSLPHDVK